MGHHALPQISRTRKITAKGRQRGAELAATISSLPSLAKGTTKLGACLRPQIFWSRRRLFKNGNLVVPVRASDIGGSIRSVSHATLRPRSLGVIVPRRPPERGLALEKRV